MTDTVTSETLLRVDQLGVTFPGGVGRNPVVGLRDVSFSIAKGETVAVVGESGSGKTTLAMAVLGLQNVSAGSIAFLGNEIANVPPARRGKATMQLQAVFQDPFSSLSPSRTAAQSIAEPALAAGRKDAKQLKRDVDAILEKVGLSASAGTKLPREFSGGQRQRLTIARALILSPGLIVCDEAVSSLDVSIQAQILNLLRDVQSDTQTSYLFITHNIHVVSNFADRVVVLYRGKVMEQGTVEQVCDHPANPYTRALIEAVPVANPEIQNEKRELRAADARLRATKPAVAVSSGCPFAPRCPFAKALCFSTDPELRTLSTGARVGCHFAEEIEESVHPVPSTSSASASTQGNKQ